jgi:pimeloyl-ACP methyl ester carboxylesterase
MTSPLAVARSGHGEPLLLLHGFGSSSLDFTPVLPALSAQFEVLNLDLPGSGRSPRLDRRPTVGAITDAVEQTLDAEGFGTVHVLGNSLGARVGLELARRGRARSVVAIAPSGLNLPPERIYQGAGMALARVAFRSVASHIEPLSRSRRGRTALLTTLKARPWRATPQEALAVREGFAETRDFWPTLLWGLMADVPLGLRGIDCPVMLAQGTADVVASGQTVRFLPLVPRARFRPLLAAGHAPQSDRTATIVSMVRATAARAARPEPDAETVLEAAVA